MKEKTAMIGRIVSSFLAAIDSIPVTANPNEDTQKASVKHVFLESIGQDCSTGRDLPSTKSIVDDRVSPALF
jgi:hypothetical protein